MANTMILLGANAANILGTPELLEMILLELPVRDMLLSQQVCATWKAAVESSVNIQRALFFLPTTQHHDTTTTQGDRQIDCQILAAELTKAGTATVALNDLLEPLFKCFKQSYCVNAKCELALPDSWLEPSASWRKMLLSQPPVVQVKAIFHDDVDCRGDTYPTKCAFAWVIRKSAGVKAGDISAKVETWCNKLEGPMLDDRVGCVKMQGWQKDATQFTILPNR